MQNFLRGLCHRHRTGLKISGLALLATLAFFAPASRAQTPPAHFFLEIEARSLRATSLEIFYDNGYGYSGIEHAAVALSAGNDWKVLRMMLPAEPLKRLRFDPSGDDTPVELRAMRLVSDTGALVHAIDLHDLRPTHQIASVDSTADGVIIRPVAGANDPMMLVGEPLDAIIHHWLGREGMSRASLVGFGLAVFLLGLLAAGVAIRFALAASGLPRSQAWLLLAGTFLVTWGVRLFFLLKHSRAMPYWDEWNGDGLSLLIPLQGGFLERHVLFIPQNEHRIVIQRLITLLGTMANGEWDPRIAMVIGAGLFAGAVALIGTLIQAAGGWFGWIAAVALALLAALPYDAANFIWGGQVQMYALVFFAVCVVVVSAAPEPRAAAVAGAAAAGLMVLGTMGSGFVVPGIAAVICAWRAGLNPLRARHLWLMTAIFAGCAALGLATRVDSRWLAPTYAHSLAEFFRAFVAYASWPLPPNPGSVVVIWLPWIFHAFSHLGRRNRTPLDWFALGLGTWTLINIVGVARARPDVTLVADARYFTTFSLSVMTAVVSVAAILARRPRGWRAAFILPAAVGVALLGGFGWRSLGHLRDHDADANAQDTLVRHYLATGDRASLVNAPPGSSPYWNSEELGVIIDSPALQPLLPAPLRKALAARTGAPAGAIEPGPLTLTARTLMKLGAPLGVLGLVLLGWFAWRGRAWHGSPDPCELRPW